MKPPQPDELRCAAVDVSSPPVRVRSRHRWLGGTRAKGVLGATLLALAVPATGNADTGYLTDGSSLYTLETEGMLLSTEGALSVSPTATASHGDGELYGIVGDSEQALHSFDRTSGANTLRGDLKEPDTPSELFVALTSLDSTLYAASYQT